MLRKFVMFFGTLVGFISSEQVFSRNNLNKQLKIEEWLNVLDETLLKFSQIATHLTFHIADHPFDSDAIQEAKELTIAQNHWRNEICKSHLPTEDLTFDQSRKLYLLCRGLKFSDNESLLFVRLNSEMSNNYNKPICLPKVISVNFDSEDLLLPQAGKCYLGEPNLERLMKFTNLTANQLEYIWTIWHDGVGPLIKTTFFNIASLENTAARRNGYGDVGKVLQESEEIENLPQVIEDLYDDVKFLYELLHAITRDKLVQHYGYRIMNPKGPIPEHLLGNMWGQDWSTWIKLILPNYIDLDERLRLHNYTVYKMVVAAEDFYSSLGLPKMTRQFWKHSQFKAKENAICHGSAASMYTPGDYRMLMCAKVSMEDFYVIHHEMGHIQYYMAYENQPTIYKWDTSFASLHESVGDAIMHGVLTPQHLHRLGLITDRELFDPQTAFQLLLQQALAKIPELPYALVIDKYRWGIYSGDIPLHSINKVFWQLNLKYRGVVPPKIRPERFFDAGAKFHVADNTPYVRYFLSSILQMEIYKTLCQLSVTGRDERNNLLEVPLHTCDIYGSKRSGTRLKKMMETGASIPWQKSFKIMTGYQRIHTNPFLEFYKPLYDWMKKYVEENNIYVGW